MPSAAEGMALEGGPWEGGLGVFEQREEEQSECRALGQQAGTSWGRKGRAHQAVCHMSDTHKHLGHTALRLHLKSFVYIDSFSSYGDPMR